MKNLGWAIYGSFAFGVGGALLGAIAAAVVCLGVAIALKDQVSNDGPLAGNIIEIASVLGALISAIRGFKYGRREGGRGFSSGIPVVRVWHE